VRSQPDPATRDAAPELLIHDTRRARCPRASQGAAPVPEGLTVLLGGGR